LPCACSGVLGKPYAHKKRKEKKKKEENMKKIMFVVCLCEKYEKNNISPQSKRNNIWHSAKLKKRSAKS